MEKKRKRRSREKVSYCSVFWLFVYDFLIFWLSSWACISDFSFPREVSPRTNLFCLLPHKRNLFQALKQSGPLNLESVNMKNKGRKLRRGRAAEEGRKRNAYRLSIPFFFPPFLPALPTFRAPFTFTSSPLYESLEQASTSESADTLP